MMEKKMKWLDWAKEIQALAQAGLAYTKDEFDKERFIRLREISCEMVAEYAETDFLKVKQLFADESGYQTPKWMSAPSFLKTAGSFSFRKKQTANGLCRAAGLISGLPRKKLPSRKHSKKQALKLKRKDCWRSWIKSATIIPRPPIMSIKCLSPVILLEERQPPEPKRKTLIFSHWRTCLNYQRREIHTNRLRFFFRRQTLPIRCTVIKRGKSNWNSSNIRSGHSPLRRKRTSTSARH